MPALSTTKTTAIRIVPCAVWSEMEEAFQGAPEPEPAVYVWVAKKKRDDLAQLDKRVGSLKTIIDEQRLGRERDYKPGSEPEQLALTALRYQEFGDLPTRASGGPKSVISI